MRRFCPHFVRRFAAGGAEVFVNISNDGYFGRSAAREQHLKIVRMRAAENRRWILRSTNDGITAAIDPAGRVVERLPADRAGGLCRRTTPTSPSRPRTRIRRLVRVLCAAASLLALARCRRLPVPDDSTSPSLTMYSLPSSRRTPFSRTPG